MARIIRNNNEPPAEQKKGKTAIKVIAALLLVCAAISGIIYLYSYSKEFMVLCFVLFVAFVIAWLTCLNYNANSISEIEWFGEKGERITGNILEEYLPDDYTVIQNKIIEYGDGKSETDNIVVGKSGVFIIEVKNMKGDIFGDVEEKYWIKDKTDQYDIEHQKEFYSPVKQVGTHVYRLANYLRENKISVYVNGAVYFANSQANLYLEGEFDSIPVFDYRNTRKMIEYIMSGTANLSKKNIERIIQLLN